MKKYKIQNRSPKISHACVPLRQSTDPARLHNKLVLLVLHCKSRWLAIFLSLFPARESLVGDIPAGDEKIANLFLQCTAVSG